MKNKVKKSVATLLLGIMLFGGVLTVQAAPTSYADHVHDYREVFSKTIQSVHSTHQYVTGVIHDISGNVIGYTYGTCDVMTYLDEYIYKCVYCDATAGTTTRTRVTHSVNH